MTYKVNKIWVLDFSMQNNALKSRITTRKLIFVCLLKLEVVIQHVMFIREPHTH